MKIFSHESFVFIADGSVAESLTTKILSVKLCFQAEFDKIAKYLR